MTHMTFKEMREQTDVYAGTITTVPEEVRMLINDQFDTRQVCDNENFPRFFRTALNVNYLRYRQLLRIEPGVAQYDWLVTKYTEAQRYTRTEGKDGHTKTEEETESETKNRTTSDITETDDRRTFTDARTETRSKQEESIRTPDLETYTNGSSSSTTEEEGTTNSETGQSATSGSKSVGKANPQSISYASATAGEIPDLNWQAPGSQTQEEGRSSGTSTAEGSSSSTSSTDGSTTDRTTQTGTETTESEGSENITRGGTTTDILDGEKRSTVTETGTGGTTSTSRDSGTKTENEEHLEQLVDTGRNESPAELLKKAASYISATSAIKWLFKQLEPCFLGIYDI